MPLIYFYYQILIGRHFCCFSAWSLTVSYDLVASSLAGGGGGQERNFKLRPFAHWNANCALGHSKQSDLNHSSLNLLCFQYPSAQFAFAVWRILYHVIVSCKGPIILHNKGILPPPPPFLAGRTTLTLACRHRTTASLELIINIITFFI